MDNPLIVDYRGEVYIDDVKVRYAEWDERIRKGGMTQYQADEDPMGPEGVGFTRTMALMVVDALIIKNGQLHGYPVTLNRLFNRSGRTQYSLTNGITYPLLEEVLLENGLVPILRFDDEEYPLAKWIRIPNDALTRTSEMAIRAYLEENCHTLNFVNVVSQKHEDDMTYHKVPTIVVVKYILWSIMKKQGLNVPQAADLCKVGVKTFRSHLDFEKGLRIDPIIQCIGSLTPVTWGIGYTSAIK